MAHNIAATLKGETRRAFSFKEPGKMGALGHRSNPGVSSWALPSLWC